MNEVEIIRKSMKNEVLEVEMELMGGEKLQMKIQEAEDWTEIEGGTRALLQLINGQQMLVEITDADEDGVSFKILGDKRDYFYESEVVSGIFCEFKG